MKEINDKAFLDLANAVILLAVSDYRKACKQLKKASKNTNAQYEKSQCLRFFRSEWFGVLTTVDGEQLIKRLDAEECV
ncbi:hypothetical protein [Butyrivibrio sp. AD3002]|uniref:hypothetical protein n=1 Tax=Butyrivibrio sp. AD3002 TaxID=1280670 RepID=UPI0003B5D451|nr:hypothetical protein [Butyrivibrio sp. AD3002]